MYSRTLKTPHHIFLAFSGMVWKAEPTPVDYLGQNEIYMWFLFHAKIF